MARRPKKEKSVLQGENMNSKLDQIAVNITVLEKRISQYDKNICKMLSERDDCLHEKGFLEGKIVAHRSKIL